jgi:hypothetical protein
MNFILALNCSPLKNNIPFSFSLRRKCTKGDRGGEGLRERSKEQNSIKVILHNHLIIRFYTFKIIKISIN